MINPVKIYPSIPIILANGSKKLAIIFKMLSPFIPIFANNHITSPAGAATTIALPSINKVLSKIDLINTFKNCGFLYGGNSKTNDEGIPFSIVFDNIFDIINVIKTPSNITNITAKVANIEPFIPFCAPAINTVATVINNGNLPITWN